MFLCQNSPSVGFFAHRLPISKTLSYQFWKKFMVVNFLNISKELFVNMLPKIAGLFKLHQIGKVGFTLALVPHNDDHKINTDMLDNFLGSR